MRTERQSYIDRLILKALVACGDYPLPETALRDQLGLRVVPPARAQEIDDSLRYLESHRRIDGLEGETCMIWQITESGRLWWQRHAL